MRPIYCYFFVFSLGIVSCVSTGTYHALQRDKSKTDSLYSWAMQTLKTCQGQNDQLTGQRNTLARENKDLNVQMNGYKDNNTSLQKQLDQLSAISSSQAESLKRSIDNIGAKDLYMQRLRTAVTRRDSANLSALMEIKAAMGSFSAAEVAIKIQNGAIDIDVADSVMWEGDSTSYMVSPKGKTVLLRLARVLGDQADLGCTVEGFTDSTSAAQDSVMDSWELSVRRAAAVVRLLQEEFNVTPSRLVAAGHGEFDPVAPNDNADDRAANRRTRFVLSPSQDELQAALEKR